MISPPQTKLNEPNPMSEIANYGVFQIIEDPFGRPCVRAQAGIAALPILPSGKIALIQRADGACGPARRWEIPRGTLQEAGSPQNPAERENLERMARRVISEQTGHAGAQGAFSFLGGIQPESAILSNELSLFCAFLQQDDPASPSPHTLGVFSWEETRQLILSSQIKDAATLSALTLYHERHGSGQRPKSYELSASFFLRDLRGDYFNAWYPDALRLLNDLGLQLDFSANEPLCVTASGKAALTDEQIQQALFCLVDIGKHCVGRLWATQIINGREAIDDLADPERALAG